MILKDLEKKIEELLILCCEKYIADNLPGEKCPEGLQTALQLPRDEKHGDRASSILLRLSSVLKNKPGVFGPEVVELIRGSLEKEGLSAYVEKVELIGGFINFWFSEVLFGDMLKDIFKSGKDYGMSDMGAGKKMNLEFVSANPTGPLTIAHGRQAAVGDALSRILRFSGYDVTNEYYLNDVGRQISLLGRSVEVRYRGLFGSDEEMPEDGYQGSYVVEIAEKIKSEKGDSLMEGASGGKDFFRSYSVEYMMDLIRKDLDDFGVSFDTWSPQSVIEKENKVEQAMEVLKEKGYIYQEEGAQWFASSRLGDDKDRVVRKSDGDYTYLAPDIAYHLDKYGRGYGYLVDMLGPDHHGYINRMKAAVNAMGFDPETLNILIIQLVTLLRGGEKLSMSTRKGEFISLRELLDELGKDVTRFFFLSRRLDSHLDFDIDLAKKESSDNPVYYIQYAHARICSIKKFKEDRSDGPADDAVDLGLLKSREERLLSQKLSEFPLVVRASAVSLEPNRVIVYLNDLARLFHSFYTECRVVSDDPSLTKARMFLVECVRMVLSNGLGLLNITLPEKM